MTTGVRVVALGGSAVRRVRGWRRSRKGQLYPSGEEALARGALGMSQRGVMNAPHGTFGRLAGHPSFRLTSGRLAGGRRRVEPGPGGTLRRSWREAGRKARAVVYPWPGGSDASRTGLRLISRRFSKPSDDAKRPPGRPRGLARPLPSPTSPP